MTDPTNTSPPDAPGPNAPGPNAPGPDAPGMEFPLVFPVKAMGLAVPEFKQLVIDLISVHVESGDLVEISENLSRTGKYVSVTCTITARSRTQLDAIYDALTEHPDSTVSGSRPPFATSSRTRSRE